MIRRLSFAPFDLPLKAAFGIATGSSEVARNVLVTVELDDGTRGFGEAAPFPAVCDETQESTLAALRSFVPAVEGQDAREWRRLARALEAAAPDARSARCAVETAVLDALTRQVGLPLWVFFGGASHALETGMTVTTGGVAAARAATREILGLGMRVIKVKIGGADPALDLARVLAIQEEAPASPLLLDGNAAFDADGALALLDELARRGVRPALFEQPVAREDLDGLRAVRRAGVPVAADESVRDAADALAVIRAEAADVVNIKLMKSGIVGGLDIAALCRSAGVGLMIGGMLESMLAMTTSACFAAGLGGFDFVDLDMPLFFAENPFDGGWTRTGARLDLLGIRAGHGVVPRSERGAR